VKRVALALALAAQAGCSDITLPPNHAPAYGYTLPATGDVFHWPLNRLPVRFYADPRGGMRDYVRRAVNLWERQFLYGEFRGVVVDDSTTADVIVLWSGSVPPDVPPVPGPPVKACGGNTPVIFDASGTALAGPFNTTLSVLDNTLPPPQITACVQRTVVHELGHTLGLWDHATDSLVIMNVTPWVPVPSDKDRRTVEYLYHVTPTIGPPP